LRSGTRTCEEFAMKIQAHIPRCEVCGTAAEVLHICNFCAGMKCDACLTYEEIIADRCRECQTQHDDDMVPSNESLCKSTT